MDISVGTSTDVNPEINIGKLIQIVKKAGLNKAGLDKTGLNQSATKEEKTDSAGNDTENGNIFLQVLQHKLAALLKSDDSDSSAKLTANHDLSVALEKLLKEDQASAGDILSGLAFLANAVKMDVPVAGENVLSAESLSAVIAAKGMANILEEEISADADQTKQNMKENEKGTFVSKTIALTADEKELQQENVIKLNPKNKSKDTRLQNEETSFKDIQVSAPVYAEADGNVSVIEQEKVTTLKGMQDHLSRQASDAGRQLSEKEQSNKAFNTGSLENTENVYADVHKKVTAEVKDKTAIFTSPEGMASSTEKVSGENQSIKTSAGITNAIQENKNRLDISNKTKTDEEKLTLQNIQDQAGQDVRKKLSIRAETALADKQTSLSLNETQKNLGKVVAAMPESAGMIDKVKTEFKSKTTSIEKNIDVNSLDTTTISGNSSTKTAVSDISPAQIINRIAAEFNETLTTEGGRIKITLTPPSLGTLDLDVMVRNGTVKVMLTADNQDVQKMLSGNLDSLKGSLQSQGLTIERCDVMMQDRREQYPQGFNQQAFNQEQSTKQHHDGGEAYNPNTQTIRTSIEPGISPLNQATWRLGNISIFA